MREVQPQAEVISRLHPSVADDETAVDRQVLNRACPSSIPVEQDRELDGIARCLAYNHHGPTVALLPLRQNPLSRLLPLLPVLCEPLLHGGLGQPIIQTHLRRLIQVLLKGLNHSGQPLILWCGERDEFETKLLAAHPADRRLLDADGRRLLRDFDQ